MQSKLITSGMLIAAALLVSACGESAKEKKAREALLDSSTDIVVSCTGKSIRDYAIDYVSWPDTELVCERIFQATGQQPTVQTLRRVLKSVAVLKVKGYEKEDSRIAYELLQFVKARGHENNDQKIKESLDVLVKIYQGTKGLVNPVEITALISQSEFDTKRLSDEGIFRLASKLTVIKQDLGY